MNSTYWLNEIMRSMYTVDHTFYLGLSSTQPSTSGTGISEPTGNNYARVLVDCFSEPELGVVKNTNELSFPKSTGIWFDSSNRARYWVLFDGDSSDAHFLSSGLLDEAKIVEGNTKIVIAANTLSISISDVQEALS